jgi:hypothetical protein
MHISMWQATHSFCVAIYFICVSVQNLVAVKIQFVVCARGIIGGGSHRETLVVNFRMMSLKSLKCEKPSP